MRESRRTMARHNPDSPALSSVLPFEFEASDLLDAAPRSKVARAGAPVLAAGATSRGPAQERHIARGDGNEPSSPAAIPRTSKIAPSHESLKDASGRGVASMRSGRHCAPTPAKGPDYAIEAARLALDARHVAGVDEAGRGPLAGPVVAAAVILDMAALPPGLDDSKKLTAAMRERLFEDIVGSAVVCVASASAAEIDRLNIRQATLLAMTRALAGLERNPCHAIVDGRDVPVAWTSRGTAVIEGDARSLSIAAASIVAKVTRDRMMRRLCEAYPAYGFSRHMGYATAEHRLALDRHGPCPFHRMTFSPIRQGMLDLTPTSP